MFDIFSQFNTGQLLAIAAIFIWSGFVRTGIGFGGAALALPLLLLVDANPVFFLPIIGLHLLFFTSLTLSSRIKNVNWSVAGKVLAVIAIPKFIGVLGLISLPDYILTIMIFSITLFYGVLWFLEYTVRSQSKWVDALLLTLGGYTSGTSLTGAPLIVAVVMRYVEKYQLRETLFVLWFVLVAFKMSAFVYYDVDINWQAALWLLPFVGVGHFIGLKAHDYFIHAGASLFHRVIGGALIVVSSIGLLKTIL